MNEKSHRPLGRPILFHDAYHRIQRQIMRNYRQRTKEQLRRVKDPYAMPTICVNKSDSNIFVRQTRTSRPGRPIVYTDVMHQAARELRRLSRQRKKHPNLQPCEEKSA